MNGTLCFLYSQQMFCVMCILRRRNEMCSRHSYRKPQRKRFPFILPQIFLTRYFKVLYLIDIDLFLICHRYEETEISGMQPSIVRLKQENTPKTRVGICSNCLPGRRRQLYAFLITIVTHNAL